MGCFGKVVIVLCLKVFKICFVFVFNNFHVLQDFDIS
jgi:hypothetical protein